MSKRISIRNITLENSATVNSHATTPNFKSATMPVLYEALTEDNREFAQYQEAWHLMDEASALNEVLKPGGLAFALEAYKIAPQIEAAGMVLGRSYLAAKEYEKALPYLKKFIESDYANSPDHELYAECLIGLKRYDEAEAQYDEAIKLAREYYGPSVVSDIIAEKAGLLVIMKKMDKVNEAIELAKESIEIEPSYNGFTTLVAAYRSKGIRIKKEGGNSDKTIEYIDKSITTCKDAIKLLPEYVYLYNELGESLSEKGDYQGAVDAYNMVLAEEKCSHNIPVLSNKINALIGLGNYKLALETIEIMQRELEIQGYKAVPDIMIDWVHQMINQKADLINILASIKSDADQIEKQMDAMGKLSNIEAIKKKYSSSSNTDSSNRESIILKVSDNPLIKEAEKYVASIDKDQNGDFSAGIAAELASLKTNLSSELASLSQELSHASVVDSDERLYQYYDAFLEILSSFYASAKAASGGMVGSKKMDGVPFLQIADIIPDQVISTSLKIINSPFIIGQTINYQNDIARTVSTCPTISSFEKAMEKAAIEICFLKADIIRNVYIDTRYVFGLFEQIREAEQIFLVKNYEKPHQRLAVEDSMKAIKLIKLGGLKLTHDKAQTAENLENFIGFIVNAEVHTTMLESVLNGSRLLVASKEDHITIKASHTELDEAKESEGNNLDYSSLYRNNNDDNLTSVSTAFSSNATSSKNIPSTSGNNLEKVDTSCNCTIMMIDSITYDNPEFVYGIMERALNRALELKSGPGTSEGLMMGYCEDEGLIGSSSAWNGSAGSGSGFDLE